MKADDQPRVRATWRDLVGLIWEGVKANKLLVVSVWLVGLVHAFSQSVCSTFIQ